MNYKIEQLRIKIKEKKLDAFLVEDPTNVFYLSNFSGTTATLLITLNHQYVLVDYRYVLQAQKECTDYQVIVYNQSFSQFVEKLNELIFQNNVHRLGFDGNKVTFNRVNELKHHIESNILPVDLNDLRAIKTDQEIETLKQAIAIGDEVFTKVYPKIKPGIKESDVVAMMYQQLKAMNATNFSFDAIVASGLRSSMPHGVASSKVIQEDDIVTVDWGVVYNHYCSDCTRTFFMSKPTNEKLVDMYNVVLEANIKTIEAVKAGVSTKEIDAIARAVVAKYNYQDYFKHGTGHGLGIDIHEFPLLNPFTDVTLKENMVITIEPGIYIEGVGGVRIEDVVVVGKDGCEVLTKLNKELQYKTEGSK